MSFAKIVLSGTVVSEPEKRFTPNNHAVTNFYLSIENPGRLNKGQEAEFQVKVNCWRNLAEAVEMQIHKGDIVLVEGKLTLNSYQTPEGVQKKSFEIDANTIDKIPGLIEPVLVAAPASESMSTGFSRGGGNMAQGGTYPQQQPSQNTPPASVGAAKYQQFSSEDLLTEDDIPF